MMQPLHCKHSALLDQRHLLLAGEITPEKGEQALSQALWLIQQGQSGVTLCINSPGGDYSASLGLMEALHASGCSLTTVAYGCAASMAALLLAAGTPGHRYIGRSSQAMIHQISGCCSGGAGTMLAQAQVTANRNQQYAELIARFSGQPLEKVQSDIQQDHWLTGREAVAYGLADHVLPGLRRPQPPSWD